jgi:erythromycin esterase
MWPRRSILLLALTLSACQGADAPTGTPPTQTTEAEAAAYIQANAIPFTTSQAGGSRADLMPLKAFVGDARIVSLGEATHGTREFFEMKHRIFEFLVREMGFTVFAIESEWAEANRVNDYVRGGTGSARVALTGMYFWTWNTQEVVDLIEWMRAYNADPANPRKLSFVGIDSQYPTMAMDDVEAFLQRADSDGAAMAAARYACLRPHSNTVRGGSPLIAYASLSNGEKEQCRAKVEEVHTYVEARRAALQAATSEGEYEMALRSARLAVQGEDVRAGREGMARDRYMAENAAWWLDQSGAGARMVIWAHNAHVSTTGAWMGAHLRQQFGDAMRVMGFSFYQGSFTALNLEISNGLGTYSFGPAPAGGYEHFFHAAGLPRFILDLRGANQEWLTGPLQVREIGCCVRPSTPAFGIRPVSLPALYDAIIFFDNTTNSRRLTPVWE